MTPRIGILNPISFGERRFYPLVRESMVSFEHGAAVTINPLALLFSKLVPGCLCRMMRGQVPTFFQTFPE